MLNVIIKSRMFGKAECRLCGENVRFALRHLKTKHQEEFEKVTHLQMSKIMKKYLIKK